MDKEVGAEHDVRRTNDSRLVTTEGIIMFERIIRFSKKTVLREEERQRGRPYEKRKLGKIVPPKRSRMSFRNKNINNSRCSSLVQTK